MRAPLGTILLSLVLLLQPLQAEQLWVRNRPFQGVVTGSGQNMLVELDRFVTTLELQIEDKGDTVVVGGFPIPVESFGSVRMVPLRDMVDAAGLKISTNAALGTIDVRAADAGKGDSGDWAHVFEESSSDRGKGSPSTLLEGPLFKVTIPSRLSVRSEMEYLKSPERENSKAAALNTDNSIPGYQEAFLVATSGGPSDGILTFTLLTDLPEKVTVEKEKAIFNYLYARFTRGGGEVVKEPHATSIAGRTYRTARYRKKISDGSTLENEMYFRASPSGGAAFLINITAPKNRFNQVAPQLRLVVRNMRYKD